MSIRSLAHVCIKTLNLDITSDFYCGILGMEKIFNFTRNGKIIGFYMKAANNTFIEAFHADEIEKLGKQALSHFCLETDSIEALRNDLVARGYSPAEIKRGAAKSLQFWIQDPNGMEIEFHQYTDQSSQMTGQDVEANW
jgi:catechol 2,3-dioxygenase-like lactoylglutathione lyase family enzyme